MPSYVLNTNVSADKVTQAFLADLSKLVSKVTGKPESYVTVRVNANQLQLFGGSDDPCASSTLENLGEVNTSNATKELNTFVSKSLGIPVERVCIFIYNLKGSHIGYGTSTF